MTSNKIDLSFSDYFNIDTEILKQNNLVDLSIVYDLPLFIDPFLIFASKKQEYKKLNNNILKYIEFLYTEASNVKINSPSFKHLFVFKEIKQNWLGYSAVGNNGCGGSTKMGRALHKNLQKILQKKSNTSVHIEEVSLLEDGIGADNISDFVTRLILDFLLTNTEAFTLKYISEDKRKNFNIQNAYFNYSLKRWMPKSYILPNYKNDFVILTPLDILVSENLVLNKKDLFNDIENIPPRLSNDELKGALNKYFYEKLPEKLDSKGKRKENTKEEKLYYAKEAFASEEFASFFIKLYLAKKELFKDKILSEKINAPKRNSLLEVMAKEIANLLQADNEKYNAKSSYEEAVNRINHMKKVIENQDGYKVFHMPGLNIQKEEYLQLFFKFVWYLTMYDVNSEVNNGRGPVDFKISYGANDQTIIEFKLASNKKLKQNLKNQTDIYAAANNNPKILKVIFYFNEKEEEKVFNLLEELDKKHTRNCILIDARSDNKPSASNAR